MKQIKNITSFSLLFLVFFFGNPDVFSQEKKYKTEEFKVHGVCDQCKERIENAAYIKGVKRCEWNKQTEKITVVYNPEKTDLLTIHTRIAEAGHSTEKVEASNAVYKKLPKCCAYREGVHKH
jgi:cation transport ATPase